MSKRHRVFGGAAAWHFKPRHVAGWRSIGAVLGFKLHRPVDRAKTQARQRIDDYADAVITHQVVTPRRRRIAVHGVEKIYSVRRAQHGFHFRGQGHGHAGGPLRQHACVHHQKLLLAQLFQHRQALLAQPVQQGFAVRCLQDAVEGVLAVGLAHAIGHRQQVQIVVAQQAARGVAIAHQAAQHRLRRGAPVDQVAQNVQRIPAGREIQRVQQALQRSVAALHIANKVHCHVFIFASDSWIFC